MHNTQKYKIPIDNPYRLILLVLVILAAVQAVLVTFILSGTQKAPLYVAPGICDNHNQGMLAKPGHCLPIKHTQIIEVQNV